MRIVVAVPSLAGGGAERTASLLSEYWAKEHVVTTIVFDQSNQVFPAGGELISLRLPGGDLSMTRKMITMIKRTLLLRRNFIRIRPDVIISLMESANFPSILAKSTSNSGAFLLISVQNNPYLSMKRTERLLMRVLYRSADRVVACSQGVEKSLQSMGLPQASICAIPNPSSVVNQRKDANRPEKPFPERYILGVGRLVPQKGFEQLIRAFALLPESDLNLVIIGEGEERGRLVSLAEDLGVRNRVHLPGFFTDLEPWYRNAQCFCLSSHWEGMALVLIEALGYGCPVVSFDIDHGPREVLLGGEAGVLVPPGDIRKFADAISSLVSSKDQADKLRMKGLERHQNYLVESVADRWIVASKATSS